MIPTGKFASPFSFYVIEIPLFFFTNPIVPTPFSYQNNRKLYVFDAGSVLKNDACAEALNQLFRSFDCQIWAPYDNESSLPILVDNLCAKLSLAREDVLGALRIAGRDETVGQGARAIWYHSMPDMDRARLCGAFVANVDDAVWWRSHGVPSFVAR